MLTFLGENKDSQLTLRLSELERSKHLWAWGDTRSGKSTLMTDVALQDIKAGRSVVLFDPKGTPGLLEEMVGAAQQCGRSEDFFALGEAPRPLASSIDPFDPVFTPTQAVGHLMSLYGDKVASPYAYYLRSVLFRLIIVGMKTIESGKSLSPRDVLDHLDLPRLKHLIEKISGQPDSIAKDSAIDGARELETFDSDRLIQVLAETKQVLQQWVSTSTEIVEDGDGNPFFRRMADRQSGILIVQPGNAATHIQTARMMFSMLVSSLSGLFCFKGDMKPPLSIHIDEAQIFVDLQEFISLILCSRGSNIWLNGYCQSPRQLASYMGREKAQKVFLPHLANHLFFKSTQEQTADLATSLFLNDMPRQWVAKDIKSLSPGEFFLQDGTRWNAAARIEALAEEGAQWIHS